MEIQQLVEAASQLANENGLQVHIMGDGTIITTPKEEKTGDVVVSAPDDGEGQDEGALLEGSKALRFFMNADSSDCLIVIGKRHIYANSGKHGRRQKPILRSMDRLTHHLHAAIRPYLRFHSLLVPLEPLLSGGF